MLKYTLTIIKYFELGDALMNKARLRSFAAWGKKKLKSDLLKVLNGTELIIDKNNIEQLTYKWFIRFVLIRYLEIKEIISKILSIENVSENTMKVNLISICNELACILPNIFTIEVHNTNCILPADLTGEHSFLERLIKELDEETCSEVEVIGWLHQFYKSEEHENVVGMNNGAISIKDVPAATQLFTPKWIVKYIVDNSLGRLCIEGKGDNELKEKLEFYTETRVKDLKWLEEYKERQKFLKPEDIKFLDPACGTGHILVYAFEVFYDIYIKFGYSPELIPSLIIENNLYGLDIDVNAVNLAEAAVIIKAWEKNSSFFRKLKIRGLKSSILCIKSTDNFDEYKKLMLEEIDDIKYAEGKVEELLNSFKNAHIYGSLIELDCFDETFWNERLEYIEKKLKNKSGNIESLSNIRQLIRQASILSHSYDAVCTNPPYMSKKYMEGKLKEYIKNHYINYNGDLFSVFIIRNLKFTKPYGYAGFMTPFVWMFIKEFEELRKFIIENKAIIGLVQLEYSAYTDATVPICTFVLGNFPEKFPGEYIKLSDFKGCSNQPVKTLEAINNFEAPYRYSCSLEKFKSIPGSPIAYWISDNLLKVFARSKRLEEVIDITGSQNITADNDRYLRRTWEINNDYVNKRWCFYTKGGDYRKWYGNIEYLVDWSEEARNFYKKNKTSNLLNENYCFREGITYNGISVKGFAVREAGRNIYDKGGPTFHLLDETIKYYILALLNSKVINYIMQLYNPTINYQVQDVKNIPFILSENEDERRRIDKLSKECIEISKDDWTLKETSWEFEMHPFIKYKNCSETLEEVFKNWNNITHEKFNCLKHNEEELNNIFIDIYNLKGELSPSIDNNEVTVSKADLTKDVKSFISYGIGCIMGRFTLKKYCFEAESNRILPQSSFVMFEDSITNKFIEFLKIAFGESKLQENLEFIANALGKRRGEKSFDTLNRYLLKEFYKEHLKTYKKRPVYWLFKCGKSSTFNALVYYHECHNNVINILKLRCAEILKEKLLKLSSAGSESINGLEKEILELKNYLDLLEEYAARDIKINMDDGIYNNYCKLKGLLSKI